MQIKIIIQSTQKNVTIFGYLNVRFWPHEDSWPGNNWAIIIKKVYKRHIAAIRKILWIEEPEKEIGIMKY